MDWDFIYTGGMFIVKLINDIYYFIRCVGNKTNVFGKSPCRNVLKEVSVAGIEYASLEPMVAKLSLKALAISLGSFKTAPLTVNSSGRSLLPQLLPIAL